MDPREAGIVGRGTNSESRLVVGLGNPTTRYACTRHNLGFRVLDSLSDAPTTAGVGDYLQQQWFVESVRVISVRPLTYMNRSGIAVRQAVERFGVAPEHCLIVVDDATRDLGRLRLRSGGSAGGHNGLKSVEEYLQGQNYPRLKMGCGPVPEGCDLADWVLGGFTEEQEKEVEAMVERACDAVITWVLHGAEETMARFNG